MIKGSLGKKLLFCICLFATSSLLAQAPQSINYQAVARNTETGEELVNQALFISAKVLLNGPQGDIVYQENHSNITTNSFGLFTLQIGDGEVVAGQFDQVDWAQGNHWLEIDLDIGNGLETIGSMQFVSVPYALFAENVGNADDADADPENEVISGVSFSETSNILGINEAGENYEVDLTVLKNDADANPQNEIVTSLGFDSATSVLTINEAGNLNQVTLNFAIDDADADPENELIASDGGLVLSGNTLEITEGGIQHEVDLSDLEDDADADPENELISPINGLVLSGTTLGITEGGIQNDVDLSDLVNDADADPENELINSVNGLVLDGDTMLQITEGGVLNELNLSPLIEDEDWISSNTSNSIYNDSDKVGVGTSSPNSTFHVEGSVAYAPTIIVSGPVNETYNVGEGDYAIVCKCGLSGGLAIEMPDPTNIPGRIINVIRTGAFPINGEVDVLFNGAPVDYVVQDFNITGVFGTISLSFMSLGPDGWVVLYQE